MVTQSVKVKTDHIAEVVLKKKIPNIGIVNIFIW